MTLLASAASARAQSCLTEPDSLESLVEYPPLPATVRALAIFVRFPDDESSQDSWPIEDDPTSSDSLREKLPDWAYDVIEATSDTSTFRETTLSGSLYRQSRTASGSPHLLYGDVVPFVYRAQHPSTWYHPSSDRSYAFLTREVLDYLTADPGNGGIGLDLGLYDSDSDADDIVEMILMVVRHDDVACPSYCGEANLRANSVGGPIPVPTLEYPSATQGMVEVGWGSGSYHWTSFFRLGLYAHEYGHHLFGSLFVHKSPVLGNEVPQTGNTPNEYFRMAGYPWDEARASMTFTATERRLLWWIEPTSLATSQAGFSGRDLYSTGDAFMLDLGADAPDAIVTLSNRQESLENGLLGSGLLESGLLVEFACRNQYDVLPPDNHLENNFGSGLDVYADDALEP